MWSGTLANKRKYTSIYIYFFSPFRSLLFFVLLLLLSFCPSKETTVLPLGVNPFLYLFIPFDSSGLVIVVSHSYHYGTIFSFYYDYNQLYDLYSCAPFLTILHPLAVIRLLLLKTRGKARYFTDTLALRPEKSKNAHSYTYTQTQTHSHKHTHTHTHPTRTRLTQPL